MPRIWNLNDTFGFSSTFSLPTVTLPAYSDASASTVGPSRLQGPHHSAQKSTSTGAPDFSTLSSKFPSVNVCTFSVAIASPRSPPGLHRPSLDDPVRFALSTPSYILTYSAAERSHEMLATRPFERAAPCGFLVGLRTPALARHAVGNHVVAERRVLRRRREFQSFARKLHGFVEPLFLIEVRLGEEQVTFGEARVDLDRQLERVDLAAPIADSLVHAPEVEGRLVAVGVQLDLLHVLGDRALQVALLLGEQREVVVREPDVGLLGNRGADIALGGNRVAAAQRDDAEGIAGGGELRFERQCVGQFRLRVLELAVVDQDLRRLESDLRVLRIELHEAAVADHRLLVASERPIRIRHVDHDEVVIGLQLQGALVPVDRPRVFVAAVVLAAHHEPGVD